MALADRLATIKPKPISWAQWMISLDPKDREALEASGRDPQIGTMAILAAVIAEGGPNSKDAIRNWREELLRDAR